MINYSSSFPKELTATVKEHICKFAADAEVIDTIYFKLEGCFAIVVNCTEGVCYFNLCRTTSETFAKITFYDEVPYPWERVEKLYEEGRLTPLTLSEAHDAFDEFFTPILKEMRGFTLPLNVNVQMEAY